VTMRIVIRLAVAALLGASVAVLVSCGGSGAGLIPASNAGPLQKDFEAVAQAAASGNGNCATTESLLGKTEQDFLGLPASVDKGLHRRLQEGISNLHKRALAMCIQPNPTLTSPTATATTTTPSTTTSTNTQTTPATTPSTTTSTQTTPTTSSPPGQGGGIEAPGEGAPGVGKEGSGKENSGKEGSGKEGATKEGAGNGASNSGGASAGGGK
jgi:hypothetical protein